jgi:hypothetical protein
VKSMFQLAPAALAALALLLAPLTSAVAQALKPVAVVSIASIKEDLADVGYVTRAAGMADYGDTAKFFASALSAGLNKERPLGLYVLPKAGNFHAVAFIPLEPNGLDTILKVHKEQLGERRDAGNGIIEIGNTKTAFVKEHNGWAFIAENKEYLTAVPPDPVALLGDLPQKYNVAAKLFVQNIPEELRRTGIDQIKFGMERFLDSPAARQGKIDREQAREITKASIANIEKLINESDEILIGLGIDETAKHVVLDIGFSAKEGSSLARSMAMQTNAKTNFAGFTLPEASVTLSLSSKSSPEDIEQVKPALKAARAQWSKQIDDSPDIPADKREAIKATLGQLFDVIEKTVTSGRMDGGGALVLLPKSVSFAFGGLVEDGPAIEKFLKSLVDLGATIPNFPQVQLNAGSIGDMKLNRLTAPIPGRNDDARELLGDNLEIIVAVGPKSVIVTGGKNAEALLRKVIDRSAQEREKSISPFSLNVALLPILKFYKSVDDNPIVNSVLASLEQTGNDHVTIANQAAPRSSTTRIEIQEGVIKAIGEGAKSAGVRPGGR